ncbi:MAG: hypothetical protein U0869_11875 [Chloroflexota bacterium]
MQRVLAFAVSLLLFGAVGILIGIAGSKASGDFPGFLQMSAHSWTDKTCLLDHEYDYTLYSDDLLWYDTIGFPGARVRVCRAIPDLCTVPMPTDDEATDICSDLIPNAFARHKVSAIRIDQLPKDTPYLCLFPEAGFALEGLAIQIGERKLPYRQDLPAAYNDNVASIIVGHKEGTSCVAGVA